MRNFIIFSLLLFMGLLTVSCNTANISVADAQYKRGEYFDAAATYRKVYNKTSASKERKKRGEIAYKLATCYRYLSSAPRASAAYQNALRYNYPDSMALYYLAKSFHQQGKYRDAEKYYTQFLQRKPEDLLAKNGLRGCELAIRWKAATSRYKVRKAAILNSRRSECAPVLAGKEYDILYITSANDKASGTNKSEITGLKNNDIFISKKNEKGEWQRPEIIEGELNSEFDEGILAFSPDGNTMYLSKAKREPNAPSSVEIYTSSRSGAKWSAPQKYSITGDTISVFAHPAVSPDGSYLYFVSDMPGGIGGNDIWRISLTDKESAVENLGPQVNTPGNEMFPSFRANGEFYFSSDGHPGMGGLDIFKAQYSDLGVWKIENLQYPINSAGDDFGITFGSEEAGFFSSNRDDARGYDHIYSFELPTLQVWINGVVIDREEEPVSDATVRIVGKDGLNLKTKSRKDGTYKFKIDRGTEYVMMAGCRGFLNSKYALTTAPEEKDANYRVDFMLSSITKPVLVENIFFEFDKATLTPESTTALNELVTMLNDNPNVTIELSAHTDMKGSDPYNMNLSDRRAKSVVDYLIAQGIPADRLTPKGYGESLPKIVTRKLSQKYPFLRQDDVLTEEFILNLTPEQQEIANSINRRTEFKVLKTTYGLY